MTQYEFPQEFLNKVNAAINQPSKSARDLGFYKILQDKTTSRVQRSYVKSLMNGTFGKLHEVP